MTKSISLGNRKYWTIGNDLSGPLGEVRATYASYYRTRAHACADRSTCTCRGGAGNGPRDCERRSSIFDYDTISSLLTSYNSCGCIDSGCTLSSGTRRLCLLSFVGVYEAEFERSTAGNAMINNGRRGPAVHCAPADRCAAPPPFSRPRDAIKPIRDAAYSTLTRHSRPCGDLHRLALVPSLRPFLSLSLSRSPFLIRSLADTII